MTAGLGTRRDAIAGLASVAIAGCASSRGATNPSVGTRADALAHIDAALADMVPQGFAGVVLLRQSGSVLLHKAYGLADQTTHRPVTLDTGFDIGSLVKPFTASAILKLEARGALATSAAASRFLPELTGDKAAITIDQLLSHTAGLPDFVNANGAAVDYATDPDYQLVTRAELLQRAGASALQYAPGTTSRYSNLGYSLLAAIIEAAAEQPYEAFVQQNLFAPAGMTRTGYIAPHWSNDALAVGVSGGQRWGTPLDHPWLPDGPSWNLRGNGGMISTSAELAKWIDALQRGAVLDGAARDKLYALYVHRNRRGALTMGAAGSNDVFCASYLWYLEEDRLIIATTSDSRVRAENIIPDLAAKVRDLPAA